MKKVVMIIIGSLIMILSTYSFSGCNGGCGSTYCNPYESNCQCTDPSCNSPWDSDCTSRAYCCEAFGNIGAR